MPSYTFVNLEQILIVIPCLWRAPIKIDGNQPEYKIWPSIKKAESKCSGNSLVHQGRVLSKKKEEIERARKTWLLLCCGRGLKIYIFPVSRSCFPPLFLCPRLSRASSCHLSQHSRQSKSPIRANVMHMTSKYPERAAETPESTIANGRHGNGPNLLPQSRSQTLGRSVQWGPKSSSGSGDGRSRFFLGQAGRSDGRPAQFNLMIVIRTSCYVKKPVTFSRPTNDSSIMSNTSFKERANWMDGMRTDVCPPEKYQGNTQG